MSARKRFVVSASQAEATLIIIPACTEHKKHFSDDVFGIESFSELWQESVCSRCAMTEQQSNIRLSSELMLRSTWYLVNNIYSNNQEILELRFVVTK